MVSISIMFSCIHRPAEYEIPTEEEEEECEDKPVSVEPTTPLPATATSGDEVHQQETAATAVTTSPPKPEAKKPAEEPFAQCVDARNPKGWLVDLLNRFGHLGGFDRLLERFCDTNGLTVPLIHALVRPFGQCHALLTRRTLNTYLMPIVEGVPMFLETLSDDDLKKEVKSGEAKNDGLSAIVKSLKCIASALPNQEETVRQLEMFR